MDSWFTTEPFIQGIKAKGLDVIGMVKQLRQSYEYNGKLLNLRKLFQSIPNKNRGDIISSAIVKTKNGIPCQIEFIHNQNCKREYIAILSTDISLDDCKIVRLYSRRWLIETCFRAQKQYFKLGTETYARDYDNLISFVSVASIRFIMMEFWRRSEEDEFSLGALFRYAKEQLRDIPYQVAIDSLMRCFISIPKVLEEVGRLKKRCFTKAEQIINDLLGSWFNGICNFLKQVIPLRLAGQ